ncbi:MAG TPA: YbjN domain-containing protein [Longimicrobiales bacterium]|nr:YbjN domain-containing protein [Longimicrobiales bacterium]
MTTHSLMQVVTDLITHLDAGTLQEGFLEPLERGSARGHVGVIRDPSEPAQLLLIVRMEVMRVPATARDAFHQELLSLNHGLLGRASFSVGDDGRVFLSAGRPVEDLDPSEVVDLLLWTSQQADRFDDLLIQAFPPPDAR